MKRQLEKYAGKLIADGVADASRMAVLAKDDRILEVGCPEVLRLGRAVLERLNVVSLVVAAPSLPLVDVLFGRLSPQASAIVPLDTETRTFLHDIPVVRRDQFSVEQPDRLVELLGQRKGVLVEGVGIMTTGSVTVELGYINYCSIYHALFIKILLDFLQGKPPTLKEIESLHPLWKRLQTPIPELIDDLREVRLDAHEDILSAMELAGRRTVELQLVDSFFGNISCRKGARQYISQTGASLDELSGCIDIVADDNSSTAGITASSELIAHRAIYQQTGCVTILHGHPKFSVILSLLCEETDCRIEDCWRECQRVRYFCGTPIVAGEVGAGGIAKKVPPVIGKTGTAIVYGHGVFATGTRDFAGPLGALIRLENDCRREYLRLLQDRVTDSSASLLMAQTPA
ncbi:MAG: class II aldolase/adducin family protein [Desulfuromonadales bacterium]|nr:class II aldolase/adducin family protein [Desulfuromonadales bacterium]